MKKAIVKASTETAINTQAREMLYISYEYMYIVYINTQAHEMLYISCEYMYNVYAKSL